MGAHPSDEEAKPLLSLQGKSPSTADYVNDDIHVDGTGRISKSFWTRFRQPSVRPEIPYISSCIK